MPSKNYIWKLSLLIGLVIACLLLLYLIPTVWMEKYHLRPIDILSDIRTSEPELPVVDSTLVELQTFLQADTCLAGMTCFDDFSPGQNGLSAFFDALNGLDTLKRPVRIAFFSDSFTEGDIFSGDLRACFQDSLGGSGAGMLPVTSTTNSFRRTVIHRFGQWNTYSLISQSRNSVLGIAGNAFAPGDTAWVYYAGVQLNPGLDTCRRVSVFYSLPAGNATISYRINKQERQQALLESSDSLPVQRLDIDASCGNIYLSFPGGKNLIVYGVSMEDKAGVLLDNFAMRGSSGTVLKCIPEQTLKDFNRQVKYDLIILQYGLNVMEANKTKYEKYGKDMAETVRYLQKCFPETSFLLLGIPDRSQRKNGTYQTMPGVWGMNAEQQKVCAETGIVYWNLFEAMGGENSMADFVSAKPSKATKDYTHLTFEGGKYLGELLFKTIMYEKERYDKQKKISSAN